MLTFLEKLTGTTSYYITFTITFLIAMGLPILALFLTSFFSNLRTKEGVIKNFARFGYALIPLDLAGHLAHNLFHLLAEGKAVLYTFMGLFGARIENSPAILSTATIQILQYLLIFLGMLGSMYTAYRISKSYEGKGLMPHIAFILLLGAINAYLFYLPMAMRM